MEKSPSVSIIIPTLNRPKLLKRALESIQEQTFSGPIKCIVVDSSNNTKTEEVVKNLNLTKKNFIVQYQKNNFSKNAIDNYAYAIDDLSSDFSKFLNDDDWLEPSYIKECIKIFEKYSVSSVISNIRLHKEFAENKAKISNYYKYDDGIVKENRVLNALLGIENMLPVTPTAALFRTNSLIESFYSSLEHFDCTRHLFGFDFHMAYYPLFKGQGTYLIQKDLVNAWAGDDSMTLNVKIAKISYCYFYSLIRLLEISQYNPTEKQKKIISHKIAVIRIKSFFNSDYKKIILPTDIKAKIIFSKVIKDLLKKLYTKFKYKFIKNQ